MKHTRSCLLILTISALSAAAAQAQATRTWVSGVGDDANPCSRTAPCKTFAGAIVKTAPGGEISVLDPGGFGSVTITKAITINGDGTLAGILGAGVTGIIVNAGVNDNVIIRNISINGAGLTGSPGSPGGVSGVRYLAGESVTLENVTITNFANRGVEMSLTTNGKLIVRDSSIKNTGVGTGILVTTTAGQAQAILDNVDLSKNATGLEAGLNGRASITNSTISGNLTDGVLASNASSRINVDSCQLTFNDGNAVNASVSGATIRLANSQIYNNNVGIAIGAGGVVETDGRNRVQGNVSTNAPNGTITVQ